MTLHEYRQIIAPASILIPIIIVISGYGKMPAYAKWLLAYLVMTAIVNTTNTILTWNGIRNLWILHIYTILESFLLLYYFKLILLNKTVTTIITVLLGAFPLYCIINLLFLQRFNDFNTYTRPVEAIMFLALCAVYWWQENEEDSEKRWENIPNNWVVTGLMIFFAGALFIFLLPKYIMIGLDDKKAWNLIWNTNATFVLIEYLLMAIGFIKCKK